MSQSNPGNVQGTGADKFKSQVAGAQATTPTAMEERELWSGTFSSKAMMGNWVMAAIVSIALIGVAIYLVVATEYEWKMTALYVALGVSVLWWIGTWLLLVLRQWSVHYQVTTQRLVHQQGILNRTNDRIEIINVDDVSFTQSIFDRMFGVGDIKIMSNDQSHPQFVMRGIGDVQRVANIIDDARRDERRRRGVRIVD